MNFRKNIKSTRTFAIDLTPLIDVIFQLIIFFMLSSSFTTPTAIDVKLPKAVTSDAVNDDNMIIVISSENIIYHNNGVITIDELRELLGRPYNRKRPVLIKADRRASVGRIVDVWDIGRHLGIERINIATDQEE
ncbi:MAG: biopolymer transporter ExbD [Elusimicrobia bacterium]|nr:biopolymer transporter ExbD [Elusimicrobiota bacterium]